MKIPSRAIVVVGAVVVAACTVVSIGRAAQKADLSLAEVTGRLLDLEDRVARIEQRLNAAGEAPASDAGVPQNKPVIEITSPKNGSEVGRTVVVEGVVRVNDLAGRSPIVGVHPMLTDLTWIQPEPLKVEKVADGYRFRCRVYCGSKRQGVGEQFELYAFLPKKGTIKEGDVLEKLPEDVPASLSVVVTRTK
ncbi:MAG: hypothetical protein HQ592_00585 [Planctomycetes bacterium]|nr:hypothetical protein [Planctomycetota bacterium]